MNPQILPMTLGDIFERTFSLIGKTFIRNLIAALIFLVIPTALLAIAADNFYSTIANMSFPSNGSLGQNQPGLQSMLPFISEIILFIIAILILSLCMLLAEITISYIVGKEILDEQVSFNKAMQETFYMKWLYGIGQGLLKYLIIGGGVGILVLILSTFSAVIDDRLVTGILIALCLIVAIPVMLFLVLRWCFSLTAVAVENLGPIDSLRQSWFIVKGYWWRTFGILFLLSILSQFVINILSVPFTFGGMWNFYKIIFTSIGSTGGQPDPQALHEAMKSFGAGIGIEIGIVSMFSLLVTPVFTVVMYFDLRARKNDLPGIQMAQQTGVQPSPPEISDPRSDSRIF